jgi:hypothetical protein
MVSTHVFLWATFADILGSVRTIQNTLLIIIFTNDLIMDGYHKSSSGKCTPAVSHALDSNLWTSGAARSYTCIPCTFFQIIILSCVVLIFHFVVADNYASYKERN